VTTRTAELLLGALLTAGTVAADCTSDGHDVLAQVRARGTLRVAHTNDYRPFSFLDAQYTPAGIDADLARHLAQSLDVSLVWVDTTWSTLTGDLRANRYDIAMSGVSVTAERAAVGCFSTRYFTTGKTALTRCASQRTLTTLAQIDSPDVTVIVNRGGTNERFVHEHLPHARILVRDDNRTVFGALASGEADVMITDAVEAQLEAAADQALCVADPPPIFERVEKAYLIPKDAAWKAWLDAWLARLEASGELAAVTSRYLPERKSAATVTRSSAD
jgi:ABC-type amino acid transport substrate-binding protein